MTGLNAGWPCEEGMNGLGAYRIAKCEVEYSATAYNFTLEKINYKDTARKCKNDHMIICILT